MEPNVIAKPTGRRIDLACGQNCKPGFEGLDLYAPNCSIRWDLRKHPWPIEDGSCSELHCSHFIEHLPACEVEEGPHAGKDHLFAFFDECYRILEDGASMLVVVPNARSNRAFQDPTHRRFIVAETFAYLWGEWRDANGLSHYNVDCNFAGRINHTVIEELTALNPETARRRMETQWNQIPDWHVTLIKLAPGARVG